jgi:hypothetical protein
LDIVSVRALAGLENGDELMLGAVEAPHSWHVLGPNRYVQEPGINDLPGDQQLGDMRQGDVLRVVKI